MDPNIRYGTDGNATLIEEVSCSIRYLTLLQCSVHGQYSAECSNDNLDVVINCCEYYMNVHVLIYHFATSNYDCTCFVVTMYDCLLLP